MGTVTTEKKGTVVRLLRQLYTPKFNVSPESRSVHPLDVSGIVNGSEGHLITDFSEHIDRFNRLFDTAFNRV